MKKNLPLTFNKETSILFQEQNLDSIRPDTIWDAVKSKANQIGGISVTGLSIIASTILQEMASNKEFIQSIIETITR